MSLTSKMGKANRITNFVGAKGEYKQMMKWGLLAIFIIPIFFPLIKFLLKHSFKIILFFLAVIALPLVLIFAIPVYFYQRGKLKKLHSITNKESFLTLLSDKRKEILESDEKCSELEKEIESVHFFAEDNYLVVNKDGSYDRRSQIGRDVMRQLDDLQEGKEAWKQHQQSTWSDIFDLQKIDMLNRKIKMAFLGIIFWMIAMRIIPYFFLDKIISIQTEMYQFIDNTNDELTTLIITMTMAGIATIFFLTVVYLYNVIINKRFEKYPVREETEAISQESSE